MTSLVFGCRSGRVSRWIWRAPVYSAVAISEKKERRHWERLAVEKPTVYFLHADFFPKPLLQGRGLAILCVSYDFGLLQQLGLFPPALDSFVHVANGWGRRLRWWPGAEDGGDAGCFVCRGMERTGVDGHADGA